MTDPIEGRELLAIRARTMRARNGLHQSLRQTEADREALMWEVERLRTEQYALIERVKAEHPDDGAGACETCSNADPTGLHDFKVPMPCPTLVALDTSGTPESPVSGRSAPSGSPAVPGETKEAQEGRE